MRAALFLLLAACGDPSLDEGASTTALEQAPPPLGYLSLGVSALNVGEQVTLTATGADPGDTVAFYQGDRYGAGACPAGLGGGCLQVTGRVRVLGRAVASAAGVATFQGRLPPIPLGRQVAFQAAVLGGSPKMSETQERRVRANGSTAPYGVGATYELGSLASVSPDVLIGHPILVTDAATVTALGCWGSGGNTRFQAALYDDAGNQPGTLVAETAPGRIGTGPSVVPVRQAAPVSPGQYWLMSINEGGMQTFSNGAHAAPEWLAFMPFGGGLPARFRNGSYFVSPRIDCFAVLE